MKRATPTLGTVKRQRTETRINPIVIEDDVNDGVEIPVVVDLDVVDADTLQRILRRAPTLWERINDHSRATARSQDAASQRAVQKREELPALSPEQQSILDAILSGDQNVMITGGAGTGKSRMIHAIYEGLSAQVTTSIVFDAKDRATETTKKRWSVKVMAPTGVAALLLPYGRTYHRVLSCGVSKSIHTMISNAMEYKKDRKFSRWNLGGRRYAFILDEAFMVSGQQMDRLDTMMRQLSQCDEPFGGHRVILVGDPYQLGPVARAEGMLFSSTFFRTILQRFVLTRCFRQENAEFVALLDRIRRGVPTAADHDRLRRFESNNVENCVKLVPTKNQAAELNAQALAAVPGVSRVYRARDTVYDQSYAKMLEDMMAPAQLEIKIGSRVMVIRNINDVVVNGSTGIVSGMYDKEIDVKLGSGIISLSPFEFTVEKRGKTLLKRVAFPIVPADAVNIHKSQGLSLDRVYVDCDRMFACGQFYVALSRCKTEQGLMLKNYSPKAIMVDPDVVKFMQSLD